MTPKSVWPPCISPSHAQPKLPLPRNAPRKLAVRTPIPPQRKAAVAQTRAEEDSRREANTIDRLMGVVKKGPDTAQAAKVGEPTLVDPTPVSANQLAGDTMRRALGSSPGGTGISLETVKSGAPGPNEP